MGGYRAPHGVRRGGNQRLHLPIWVRVIPNPQVKKQVLLVDDDGSSAGTGLADYSAAYKAILGRLGVTFDYVDVNTGGLPDFNTLFGYRSVVLFTGDNASADTSGLSLGDHDRLSEWLDSGGTLLAIGQNVAEAEDDNSTVSARLGRARIYNGYLGVAQEQPSLFTGAPPVPTAAGEGPFAGQTVNLTGLENSVEATSPLGDTDTFNALSTMTRFFRPLSSTAQPGWGLSFGRSSEPSLDESRLQFRYRSAVLGFGLEGVDGTASQDAIARTLLDWLSDQPAVTVSSTVRGVHALTLTANATSTAGASFSTFRWDFGDGSGVTTSGGPTVEHIFRRSGSFLVRVEATDSFGHRTLGTQRVTVS